jgi:hypothetical protein
MANTFRDAVESKLHLIFACSGSTEEVIREQPDSD